MSAYTACVGRSRKKQGHEPGIVLDVPGQGQGSPNQLRMRQLNFRSISQDRSYPKARFRPSSGTAPLTVS
jgi:hypothetical protein